MLLLRLLLAVAASMGLGFAWYSPALFGKRWSTLMGFSKESLKAAQAKMAPMYTLSAAAAILTAFMLMTFGATPTNAFMLWLGFMLPVQLTDQIFNSKPFNGELLAINTGYQLTSLLLMSLII